MFSKHDLIEMDQKEQERKKGRNFLAQTNVDQNIINF